MCFVIIGESEKRDFVGAFESIELAKKGIQDWGSIMDMLPVQYASFDGGKILRGITTFAPLATSYKAIFIVFEYEVGTIAS